MNVSTIAMDRAEAREQLRVVRKQLHRRADEEYQALAEMYEHLEKGLVLIDVQQAIRDCPVDENGLPKLAIARADRPRVTVSWDSLSTIATFDGRSGARRDSGGLRIRIDLGRRHGKSRFLEASTLVPMIPPHIRTIRGCGASSDRQHYLLWEVEKWALVPPVDPFLLRHVRGTMYAVIAEWDLTPLERMVMAARAQA